MKKLIVLAATALLIAGCSATVPSTSSQSSSASAASSAESSAPKAGESKAPEVAATATDTITAAPKLTLAETCTQFLAVLTANRPAQGSKDNQAAWVKTRNELRPVFEGAAPETKSFADGLAVFYNTQADNWDPAQTMERNKAASPYFEESSKVCADYFPKR